MNFKLSIFLALVICTLMVLATPLPVSDYFKMTLEKILAQEISCAQLCSSAPKDEIQSCTDKCEKKTTDEASK